MDYGEQNTLWVPIGTLSGFGSSWLDPTKRDCQIFCEEKSTLMDPLQELPQLESFGTYRLDPCCGKSFDQLKSWKESETLQNITASNNINDDDKQDS
jgi:hypothetical protein